MGPNSGSNVGQNESARGIAHKHGLTAEEWLELSDEIHREKDSGAYDLDINGNLAGADIEDMAVRNPEKARPLVLEEYGRLQAVLRDFLGATLSRVRIGAGEIFVECEQPDGVWTLGSGGSMWALVEDDQPLVQYQDDEREVERFADAVGRRVVGIDPGNDGSGLRLDLDDEMAFLIIKSPEDMAPKLPVFELFTPAHHMIVLHRDGALDDVRSDVPIRDLVASGSLRHWPSDAIE